MSPAPALRFEDVRVRRGRRDVLHVAQLDVADGDTLAVLGPNGAGKSTLLLTAALLLPVSAGRVSLFGEAAGRRDLVRLRRRTATVFQEPALLDMNVRRNLETALSLHGLSRAERGARATEWLARLGVGHLADAMPHNISGGEARRVSLARAFAVRPEMLFLDEPFSALDLETRTELVGDLRTLLRAEQTTALLVTHDHSEAQLLAERAAVLIDGRVEQADGTAEVLAQPASPAVAAFLGHSLVARGDLPPAVTATLGAGALVGVPPAAVRLIEDAAGSAVYAADIVAVQGALGQGRLLVTVGAATVAVALPVEAIGRLGLGQGAPVQVAFDTARLVTWGDAS